MFHVYRASPDARQTVTHGFLKMILYCLFSWYSRDLYIHVLIKLTVSSVNALSHDIQGGRLAKQNTIPSSKTLFTFSFFSRNHHLKVPRILPLDPPRTATIRRNPPKAFLQLQVGIGKKSHQRKLKPCKIETHHELQSSTPHCKSSLRRANKAPHLIPSRANPQPASN